MNPKKILANQVRLVQHDQIPLSSLISQANLLKLRSIFNFTNAEVGQTSASDIVVKVTGGIYQSDQVLAKIIELVIFERKIILAVEGTSGHIEEIFAILNKFLAELAETNVDSFLEPIVVANESEIVAQFKFDYQKLLSRVFNSFVLDNVTAESHTELAKAIIKPKELKFEVDYLPVATNLKDYNIDISKKEFVLSPRPGYPLAEKIFYSKAPVTTDVHIKLLETLEELLQ